MRQPTLLLTALLLTAHAHAQYNEFQTYPNGLIYSEQAMGKLSHIVDSLNLKFKSCDLNKVFYAKQQTVGHLIKLDTGDIKAAVKDMERHIPVADFLKKYPLATIDSNILIIRQQYKRYDGEEVVEIEHFDLKDDYGFSISSNDLARFKENFQFKWLFRHDEKTAYWKESVTAFYFPNSFSEKTIPQKYARMIGYADCLIDTTTTKLKDELEEGRPYLPDNWTALSQAEKAALLDTLRSTQVIGFCSQDSSPREHAVNIALLSAETANWEVFLKAHLDIMNDRFERMTDGSYAWGERKTYIRELEELDINVTHLLLGTSLRIENPAKNHYYGSIGRLGRALSETKNRAEVETEILAAIADPELDDYNRALFYFLFLNYNHYIEDEQLKAANAEKLAAAVGRLPNYIKNKL